MVASCYSESLDFPCPLHQPLKGFGSLSVPVETCFEVSLGGRREGTAYTPGKTRTGAVFDCQKLNCMCLMNQVLHFWSWVPVEKVPLALCDSSIFRVLRNIASLRPGGPPGAGCALRVMALLMSPRQQTLSSWEKVLEIGGAKKKNDMKTLVENLGTFSAIIYHSGAQEFPCKENSHFFQRERL